jgi:hypothetical protein
MLILGTPEEVDGAVALLQASKPPLNKVALILHLLLPDGAAIPIRGDTNQGRRFDLCVFGIHQKKKWPIPPCSKHVHFHGRIN